MSNLRKRDIMGIVEFDFKLIEDKIGNSSPSSTLGQKENVRSHYFGPVGNSLREF